MNKDKSIFFFFRSNDWNQSTTGAFDVILPYQINRCSMVTLVNYGFPNSYYNIDSRWNMLKVTTGGTTYIVSIAAGTYSTISTIMSALASALNTATGLTWTISQSSTTLIITISTSQSFTIDISYNNGNNLNEILGLQSNNAATTISSVSNSITGLYVSNEFPYKTFRIHCDLVRNILNQTRDAPILAEIPISTGTSGSSTQVFAYNAGSVSAVPFRPSFQTFSLFFTDQYNRYVDFHGEDVFMCLKFNFTD